MILVDKIEILGFCGFREFKESKNLQKNHKESGFGIRVLDV